MDTPSAPRIALIHATRVAIAPIERAAKTLWPEAETTTLLDEALSVDRQRADALTPALWDRIAWLAQYAQSMGSDAILFTCSAFGPAIDAAAAQSPIPVMTPNEAMFDAALSQGARLAMVYTFPQSAPSMEAEFRDATAARGSAARLSTHFAAGALDAKRAGDDAAHDRLIAETAAEIRGADAIMLAQFSMAEAAGAVRDAVDVPVLTSPEAAIAALRRRLECETRR